MTSHRLRYTGELATTFQAPGVGYVEPGGEFAVDGDRLRGFIRRADVEHAGECPSQPCKCGEEPQPPAPATASGKPKGSRRGTAPSTQDPQG